jgi:hypothetical protein
MQNAKCQILRLAGCFAAVLALSFLAGCKTGQTTTGATTSTETGTVMATAAAPAETTAATATTAPATETTTATATTAPATETTAAVATATPAVEAAAANIPNPVKPPVRIKAGVTTPFTDSAGNVWLPDQGFADGETTERDADLQIANTSDPGLYRSERYSMSSFSYPVPNGKYIVKLHFAETYDGISGPGDRVFSFNVQGHAFNDFDIYKTVGPNRAEIVTVPIDVTDGKVSITFTPKVENPEINGIEILPAP